MSTEPAERGSDELRRAIHLAALRRFVAEGFAGARLKDIATDAGLGSAAHLYYYAPRKEDLFLEVVRTYALLPDHLFTPRNDDPPELPAVIERFLREYLDAFQDELRLLAFTVIATEAIRLTKGGAEQTALNLMLTVHRLETWYRDRVDDGSLRGVDPRRATHILLGVVNYYVMYKPDGPLTAEGNVALAREITDQLWHGLTP